MDRLWADADVRRHLGERFSAGETIFTLMDFVGMYFLLGFLFLFLTLRETGHGPDPHTTERLPLDIPATAT